MHLNYPFTEHMCQENISDAVNAFLEKEKIFPDVIYLPNHVMGEFVRAAEPYITTMVYKDEPEMFVLTGVGVLPVKIIKDHIYCGKDDKFIRIANESVEKEVNGILLGGR